MNPLLSREFLIPFDRIAPEHIEPGVRSALERARGELERVVTLGGPRSYRNTVGALDDLVEDLGRTMTVAHHLTMVATGPELRRAYNAVLPEYSAFVAQLATHEGLWRAVRDYAASDEAAGLDPLRRRRLDKLVQEFRRAGADLPAEARARIEAINVELSKLQTKFSENVLDATNAFELVLTDEADLAGLPASARRQARASAEAKGVEGWRFTLQYPSYGPFMQYSERRELRRIMHEAYTHRAAGGEFDNRGRIVDILALRREKATLLGYRDFADYRLEVNMVGSGSAAVDFEEELTRKTLPFWHPEIEALETFAREELGLEQLEPWDVGFVVERLRKARFDLDGEELRPYFPLDAALRGLFELTERLFGVTVSPRRGVPVWHPEVEVYDLHDVDGTHLGTFYADWFPRENKQGGAWKLSLTTGGPRPDGFAPHLATVVANFSPPQDGRPALLTHDEVQTMFHEFGHLLHHSLSRVEVTPLAGTSVPRDWVELPSQLLENWTWEREALDLFARHVDSGERLPDDDYRKMLAARTFMAATAQMRQLSFGTVDLALHIDYDPASGDDVIAYGNRIMERFTIRPEFAHNSFLTAFSHVFSGGYAAGYYSYKWSEVLDADAFTRFAREGIFNRETGRAYVDAILSRGDSVEPIEQFRAFMGRDPDVDALLERNLGARDAVAAD